MDFNNDIQKNIFTLFFPLTECSSLSHAVKYFGGDIDASKPVSDILATLSSHIHKNVWLYRKQKSGYFYKSQGVYDEGYLTSNHLMHTPDAGVSPVTYTRLFPVQQTTSNESFCRLESYGEGKISCMIEQQGDEYFRVLGYKGEKFFETSLVQPNLDVILEQSSLNDAYDSYSHANYDQSVALDVRLVMQNIAGKVADLAAENNYDVKKVRSIVESSEFEEYAKERFASLCRDKKECLVTFYVYFDDFMFDVLNGMKRAVKHMDRDRAFRTFYNIIESYSRRPENLFNKMIDKYNIC